VYSKSIFLSGPKARKISVPTERGHFGKVIPCLSSEIIEETKLDAIRNTGKQREVYAVSVINGSKRIWFAAGQHELKMCISASGPGVLVKSFGNARTYPDD